MQLAVWSGPRNLSTAMMYSFANRRDFLAIDEPFYASYLKITGLDHPMRSQIIGSQPTDPKVVVSKFQQMAEKERPHVYQKHMTQHMLPEIPRSWMKNVKNVFLIRHPARVISSFAKKYPNPNLGDIGFVKQKELFFELKDSGYEPITINSYDIRRDPETKLTQLCNKLDLDFEREMLAWAPGGMDCDGIWASHWYGAVHKSSGFVKEDEKLPILSKSLEELSELAMPHYEALLDFCL